jgi:hypothetical protein
LASFRGAEEEEFDDDNDDVAPTRVLDDDDEEDDDAAIMPLSMPIEVDVLSEYWSIAARNVSMASNKKGSSIADRLHFVVVSVGVDDDDGDDDDGSGGAVAKISG